MQVFVTDKLLIDIYSIKNISKISLYDVVGSENVLPGLVVFFDGTKHINLCAADKYFPEFVRKVVEVYHAESKKKPDDPFGPRIDIDSHDKEILESGVLENILDYFKFYDGKKGYDGSLLYEIDEVKLLLPLIKYHIKELFSHTDTIVNWQEGITGYRTNYVVPASISGVESDVFLKIEKQDDTYYSVGIRGLTPNNSSIQMDVMFSEYGLSVFGNIARYNMAYNYSYRPEKGIIKKQSSIALNDTTIDYQDANLPQSTIPNGNLTSFDIAKELDFYELPWGAFLGLHEDIADLSEDEEIKKRHLEYFSPYENSFMRKEFISEIYASKKSRMTLTKAVKSINGYLWDQRKKLYVIETSFLDSVSGAGYFEEHLRGKSFYHICQLKDLKDLLPENLVSVDEDKGILAGSDFMNKSRLLALLKGEN